MDERIYAWVVFNDDNYRIIKIETPHGEFLLANHDKNKMAKLRDNLTCLAMENNQKAYLVEFSNMKVLECVGPEEKNH